MRFVGNIGLAAALATLVAGTAVAIAASWGGAYFLPGAAAGLLAGAAALLRHRAGPDGGSAGGAGDVRSRLRAAIAGLVVAAVAVVAAHVAGLPAEPAPAVSLALALLIGSVARVASLRVAAGVAVAALMVVGAGAVSRPGESGAFAVTMFGLLAWSGGVLGGVGLRLLDARRIAAVEAVRRDERLSIARELHDVVAHHVTGIVVQAQAAQLVARRDPAKAGESLAGIEAAGAEALAAVRRAVGLLRDDDGDEGGWGVSAGPERITDLVRRFEGLGPAVHLEVTPHGDHWPPGVTGAVHRIVQESLTNVARHATHARTVTVELSEVDGSVEILVADDGAGGQLSTHSGYGIVGMRERVEALGGKLSAGPAPSGGWQVHGTVPLSAPR
ncbi:histidine kinase [Dactylosporangium sp. NPDC005555]|uniref:sensor histidine kinase n=1 Tax=Dactylosporangium sp. NPDC005555 TaxID=3154889 RepID=UPI0033B423F0